MSGRSASEYASSGVSHEAKGSGLAGLVRHLKGTFGNNPRAKVRDDIGYYASIVEVAGGSLGLAISTDSVGTKVLVAQMAGKHDTVGIDCVAMNANDVICVGADPIAMVDYLGVNFVDAQVVEQLGRGLAEGARRAEISIPGGELAQVRDLVKGAGDGCHYDLIGTCVGILHPKKVNDGSAVRPGDALVGIASSGLHSNGFSLARRVLFETLKLGVQDRLEDCGRTVAEELLEPTAMYVRECKALAAQRVDLSAMLNITGGAFSNLLRVAARGVGFHLHSLPDPPPIFRVLQSAGALSDAEMHSVFNMGVGFVIACRPAQAEAVIAAAADEGKHAGVIGEVVADAERRCAVTRDGVDGCLITAEAKGAFRHAAHVPVEFRR